jgi:1-acyl-sn-glycerol-3-phosphate acyltransferase
VSRPLAPRHRELPRSDEVDRPARYLLHPLRPAARAVVRSYVRVHAHHEERVPRTGPVVFAPNHSGWADGPLLAIFAPRPVHVLTKQEMFAGRFGGWFFSAAGQIRLDRFHPDPRAVKSCLRVLREGGAVGIFPEGTRGAGDLQRFKQGAAYLALVSGAPVVPVIMFGTREPGASSSALPRRGGVVDLVYGEPWRVPAVPWPRTRAQRDEASAALREHMLATLREARELTGRELPGPLPAGDKENLVPGQNFEGRTTDGKAP